MLRFNAALPYIVNVKLSLKDSWPILTKSFHWFDTVTRIPSAIREVRIASRSMVTQGF